MILYGAESALPYLRRGHRQTSRQPAVPGARRSAILRGLCPRYALNPNHEAPAPKNAFYAQSGGVSAVINASACGVIETARKHRDKIGKVYAGRARHHRRAHRGPDRHRQGERGDDPRAAPHAGRRIRLGALQTRRASTRTAPSTSA